MAGWRRNQLYVDNVLAWPTCLLAMSKVDGQRALQPLIDINI